MASRSRFGGRLGSEHPDDPGAFAGALRERIYATLTGVAVLMLLLIHVDEESTWSAVVSVVLAMGTLWIASLFSELLAHGVVRNHPEYVKRDVRSEIFSTAGQSLVTMVVPVALLLVSLTGLWGLRTALILAIASLMLTLATAAIFAVRNTAFPFWARAAIVLGELALGGIVILGKILTH